MKTIILTLALLLGACASSAPDLLQTDGPLGRQVSRVLDRHDGYVIGDISLGAAVAEAALAQSDVVRELAALPEVSRGALGAAAAPVLDRHDGYVRSDAGLDADESATYLATTDQLRRLLHLGTP